MRAISRLTLLEKRHAAQLHIAAEHAERPERAVQVACRYYTEHFVELGGRLEVCSSCYDECCRELPKDAGGWPVLRPGTKLKSLGIVAVRARQCSRSDRWLTFAAATKPGPSRAPAVGQQVTVRADDRAFPGDIRAWCRKTSHELVSLEAKAGFYEAVIKRT